MTDGIHEKLHARPSSRHRVVCLALAAGPIDTHISAQNGKLVIKSGFNCSKVEKLSIESGKNKSTIEVTATGDRVIARTDRGTRGYQFEAGRPVYRQGSSILVLSGKLDQLCELKTYFKF